MALRLAIHADIGANLTDGMFQGQYMGKAYHSPDVTKVLERAWAAGTSSKMTPSVSVLVCTDVVFTWQLSCHRSHVTLYAGVEKIIVTAGSLPEAESALALARTDGKFFLPHLQPKPNQLGSLQQYHLDSMHAVHSTTFADNYKS